MDAEFLVALTTFEDASSARSFVRALVDDDLIACGNIVPGVESIYRWRGNVETASEVVVVMKLRSQTWEALEARVRDRHPYETPELIAFPVRLGSASYLAWLRGDEAPS